MTSDRQNNLETHDKSCCATCTEGSSALGMTGFSYTVKSSHAKPYIARLTESLDVDLAIVNRVKTDFDNWLRSSIVHPDSDVTDHETVALNNSDEEELTLVPIISPGDEVDENE